MEKLNQRPLADEIALLDYWQVVWKHKWLIGSLISTSVAAALIFSILSPKIYEATATILAPREGGGSSLMSLLAATGVGRQIGGISIPSLTPNRDVFISILKSRTVVQSLAEQFKLKEYYKNKNLEDALGSLRGATKIAVSKEGVVSVKVEDRDPKMAADLANAYTEQLDRLMTAFGMGTAGSQRRFISEQLAKTEKELKAAEETLREFQERNRAVLLGDMANSMRLPTAQVPKLGIDMTRLMRDIMVQERVYLLLTQQLEQAKIGEAQDTPVVQVLDQAVSAIYKSKPKTVLNMALAGAVSLFLGIFLAFFLEYIQHQRSLARKLEG